MENKVYYGEYSLRHWIELMLKENITLPWYQRSFVWEKRQVERLIETLDNNQFIPPVIIGAVKANGEWKNYILDGQQRLTSILFAKCNKYIDKTEYASQKPETQIEQIADDLDEEDRIDEEVKIIRWNFREIIKDRQINSEELQQSFYTDLFTQAKEESFFEEHYLGFAYIKPNNNVKDEEQSKFYSDVFRNINTGGTKLTRTETRKSLYFLKEDLKDFFAPTFLDSFKVVTSSKESGLLDFIKYTSILSQYKGNNSTLLSYGGRNWEKNEVYYKEYIMAILENNENNRLRFNVSFPANTDYSARMSKLESTIRKLDIPKVFASIIEMDMYFFGLVNEVVCLNTQLDETKKDELKLELDKKIEIIKEQDNHKLNPNALKYLKVRISASIQLYNQYRI